MITQNAIEMAMNVADLYDEFNRREGRSPWTVTDLMSGFVGDVGDLSKLIMAHAGKRAIDQHDERIAHELADCLWSVIVIAEKVGVDLNVAFAETMAGLTEHLDPPGGKS